MRVTLLCTPDARPTSPWVERALVGSGHSVEASDAGASFAAAAETGHALADRWAAGPPDVVLALGWEAALAGQVAARRTAVPVVLRLARAGRPSNGERARLEAALARGCDVVLVPSAGELDRLVDRGIPRTALRVLPEAVDRSRFPDSAPGPRDVSAGHRVGLVAAAEGVNAGLAEMLHRVPGCEPVLMPAAADDERRPELLRHVDVVLATSDTDADVSLVLQAMSSGVPVVALDLGALSDLVADGVTGLLVPRASALSDALRALLTDSMRLQSMGLAAVDRVRARFDTLVVAPLLERLLLEVVQAAEPAAAS
jgi:hypothetical protein